MKRIIKNSSPTILAATNQVEAFTDSKQVKEIAWQLAKRADLTCFESEFTARLSHQATVGDREKTVLLEIWQRRSQPIARCI